MPHLLHLPVEILHEILGYLTAGSRAALASTSKDAHRLCQPELDRCVEITSLYSNQLFTSCLEQDRKRGLLVKSLKFDLLHDWLQGEEYELDSDDTSWLGIILWQVPNLETLEITSFLHDDDDDALDSLFDQGCGVFPAGLLPKLRTCNLRYFDLNTGPRIPNWLPRMSMGFLNAPSLEEMTFCLLDYWNDLYDDDEEEEEAASLPAKQGIQQPLALLRIQASEDPRCDALRKILRFRTIKSLVIEQPKRAQRSNEDTLPDRPPYFQSPPNSQWTSALLLSAHTLESLVIDLPAALEHAKNQSPLFLSKLGRLRSLTIQPRYLTGCYRRIRASRADRDKVLPPNLESFEFLDVDLGDWSVLETFLCLAGGSVKYHQPYLKMIRLSRSDQGIQHVWGDAFRECRREGIDLVCLNPSRSRKFFRFG